MQPTVFKEYIKTVVFTEQSTVNLNYTLNCKYAAAQSSHSSFEMSVQPEDLCLHPVICYE